MFCPKENVNNNCLDTLLKGITIKKGDLQYPEKKNKNIKNKPNNSFVNSSPNTTATKLKIYNPNNNNNSFTEKETNISKNKILNTNSNKKHENKKNDNKKIVSRSFSYKPPSYSSNDKMNKTTGNIKGSYSGVKNKKGKKTISSEVSSFSIIPSIHYKGKKQFYYQEGKRLFKVGEFNEAAKCFGIIEDELEGKYWLGACFLALNNNDMAITKLLEVVSISENYNLHAYVLMGMAFRNMGKYNDCISMLEMVLSKYDRFYEGWLFLAKIKFQQRKYEETLVCYQKAEKGRLPENSLVALLGKADCLRFLKRSQEAISIYDFVLQHENNQSSLLDILLKRSLAYCECGRFNQAHKDINQLIYCDPGNIEYLYFRAALFFKEKKYSDAILCYEQAMKYNKNPKMTAKIIFQIAKIQVETRDFYAAQHTLERYEFLNVKIERDSYLKFKGFIDGVINLMKKKFKEGIKIFSNIIEGDCPNFIKQQVYKYRSYGYFCLGKFQHVLEDYSKISNLEISNKYNKEIVFGIIYSDKKLYAKAKEHFDSAEKIYPLKMEPIFYKAILKVNEFFEKEEGSYQDMLTEVLLMLNKCFEINDSCPILLYHRGIINFALGLINEAIIDIEKSIEKSENNIPKGLAYASAGCYKQALIDFTHVLEMAGNNNQIAVKAYLHRSECSYLLGDVSLAVTDMQHIFLCEPENSRLHLWAGNLFLRTGSLIQAVKCYSNAFRVECEEPLLLCRVKTFVLLRELNSALDDFKLLYKLTRKYSYYFDYQCLNALKVASSFIEESDENTYKPFKRAIGMLSNLIEEENNKHGGGGSIFKISDLFFYRGVMSFFLEEHQKALEDFEIAMENRKKELLSNGITFSEEQAFINWDEDFAPEIKSILKEKMFNFENTSFNIFEFMFNKVLCYCMLEEFPKAYEECLKLLQIIPEDFRENLQSFIVLMEKEINSKTNTENNDENIEDFSLFPIQGRLCSIFPSVKIPFNMNYGNFLTTKLSFCLPHVVIPKISFGFEEDLIKQLNVHSIEKRPEAPWILRGKEGIVFTNNIQHFDELILQTEDRGNSSDKNRIEERKVSDIIGVIEEAGIDDFFVESSSDNPEKKNSELNNAYYEWESGKEYTSENNNDNMVILEKSF